MNFIRFYNWIKRSFLYIVSYIIFLLKKPFVIRNNDVHSILDEQGKYLNPGRDVIIKDFVWIGCGSTILKGTHLRVNSVVGTQSVVAGINVPQGCVVVGNPVKIIKENIHWDRERLR